jgi:hypothetical protein
MYLANSKPTRQSALSQYPSFMVEHCTLCSNGPWKDTTREIEIHTAEPLVPDRSPFEVEIAIAKVEKV